MLFGWAGDDNGDPDGLAGDTAAAQQAQHGGEAYQHLKWWAKLRQTGRLPAGLRPGQAQQAQTINGTSSGAGADHPIALPCQPVNKSVRLEWPSWEPSRDRL